MNRIFKKIKQLILKVEEKEILTSAPLNSMTFTQAEIIYNKYHKLLGEGLDYMLPYSYLNFIDICNSINLMVAFGYYNLETRFNNDIIKFEKAVKDVTGSVLFYDIYFIEDVYYNQIADKKYTSSDCFEIRSKKRKDEEVYKSSPDYKEDNSYKGEVAESFYYYCQSLNIRGKEYWEKVYERLHLTMDNSDRRLF